MPANVQTMAYVGEVPWHGLGQCVSRMVHAQDMITAAGLDWEVEKRPARGAQLIRTLKNGRKVFNLYEVVRLPRAKSEETEVTFGLVTDRYEPLQNTEAFKFFDAVVDRRVAYFETAGALGQGERVWVMAKMPEPILVAPGDECHKYLLLSNSHTGQGSVVVKFTAIRVVCQNTLMLSLNDGKKAYRIRHSRSMTNRLKEISDLIAEANKIYSQTASLFRRLADTQLKRELLSDYLEAVYPKTKRGNRPEKWDQVHEVIETVRDLKMPGVQDTLWAAYNAITYLEDHRVGRGEDRTGRLNRIWFGASANIKLKALQAAAQLLAA